MTEETRPQRDYSEEFSFKLREAGAERSLTDPVAVDLFFQTVREMLEEREPRLTSDIGNMFYYSLNKNLGHFLRQSAVILGQTYGIEAVTIERVLEEVHGRVEGIEFTDRGYRKDSMLLYLDKDKLVKYIEDHTSIPRVVRCDFHH